jgi:isopenicillin N synthase-like dioxygenase
MALSLRPSSGAAPQPRALPVIDVSSLISGSDAGQAVVGRQMAAACEDRGFFYITGHGVPDPVIAEVFEGSRALFDLPEGAKQAVAKARSTANRGYEALGGQTLEPGAPPDRKEGFYIGAEAPPCGFNRGPNQWPAELPGLEPVMLDYHRRMLDLAGRLMSGLALSLGLPADAFAEFCRSPTAILRLLHYPPQPPTAPGRGAGAHTDFGALTILLQDEVGGLEVYDQAQDGWTAAPPLKGAFVVNLGDLIARWTNDRYRSTPHRVVNRSGHRRYSVPFFLSGAPAYEVSCLPVCLKPGEQPKYPPITAEAHLRRRYFETYGA